MCVSVLPACRTVHHGQTVSVEDTEVVRFSGTRLESVSITSRPVDAGNGTWPSRRTHLLWCTRAYSQGISSIRSGPERENRVGLLPVPSLPSFPSSLFLPHSPCPFLPLHILPETLLCQLLFQAPEKISSPILWGEHQRRLDGTSQCTLPLPGSSCLS